MKIEKLVKFWLPLLLWASVIFTFSAFPTARTSEVYWQDFIVKKLAHLTEYAIFAILFYRAMTNSGMKKRQAGYWAILFTFVYGLTDEFHQSFTPGREPRIRDAAIDTAGGALGIFVLWNLLPKAPARIKTLAEKLQVI